ncbi:MAG: DUF951 domain-containing protein [Clostridia bacterium]|nr:DUF951 domain-containing protein [Clostridia bacterium]
MDVIKIKENDILQLKKKHPCGSSLFKAVRVGSDVRVICQGCGRDLTLPREKLEKSIKKIIGNGND